MKNIIIFGAGQCGQMTLALLKKTNYKAVAFTDNNEKLVGSCLFGLPVISVNDAINLTKEKPLERAIFIAAMGQGRCQEIRQQLLLADVSEECILEISGGKETFDIRQGALYQLAKEIRRKNLTGAVAELGVFKGEFAAVINDALPDRSLYLFDTFEGFTGRDIQIEQENGYSFAKEGDYGNTSEEAVLGILPHPEKAVICKGYFPETAEKVPQDIRFALVSIDADLYQPIKAGLEYFYPRMARGGYIVIHDYNNLQYKGAGQAVREFCAEEGVFVVPLPDLHGSAVMVKV